MLCYVRRALGRSTCMIQSRLGCLAQNARTLYGRPHVCLGKTSHLLTGNNSRYKSSSASSEDEVVERIADFLAQERCVRLDVRTAEEFAGGSVPAAVNIPVSDLPERLAELPRGAPIAVFCAAGVRSRAAQAFLEAKGFQAEDCINVAFMASAIRVNESE
eukprot:TRINITY_DN76809_c0_g1_i1.p2 TRINITY_DN76809_c0_g1~~TRINITY_DN76809_c0_g1_i1.p2  ORF type:complete len:160 (-),score=32.48 TRINITY_DN76809_c0_g1_i1:62-541(-)